MTVSSRFGIELRSRHVAALTFSPAGSPLLRKLEPELAASDAASAVPKRARIWELNSTFHCSIIGTCLTTGDMRRLLAKLEMADVARLSEHEIHSCGVRLAASGQFGGKLLNKALDKKHHAAIAHFSRARAPDEVRRLWSEALQAGEVPGAYWAAMTHPHATPEILRSVFEDVHMLSHLVGAANRADIRRLRALEEQLEALADKVARQQAHVKAAFISRDKAIAERQALLTETGVGSGVLGTDATETPSQLSEKLSKLSRRCERLEEKVDTQARMLLEERRLRDAACARETRVQRELEALERTFGRSAADHDDDRDLTAFELTVLYVGGRTHLVSKLRAAAELMGVTFLHHDGGEECSSRLISPLIGRADVVVFPVDCVSHDAMGLVKRTCRNLGKPYQALRSSGLATFLLALREFSTQTPNVAEIRAAHA